MASEAILNISAEDLQMLLTCAYAEQVQSRGHQYHPTDDTLLAISQVATALTTPGHRFGLFLCGTYGNGKTTMLRALHSVTRQLQAWRYPVSSLLLLDARDIRMAYLESNNPKSDLPPQMDWDVLCTRRKLLAIDDMGKEPAQQMNYGTIISPMHEIIEKRYERRLFTAISTNTQPNRIAADYGERVADRLREMMHIIPFTAKSFRQ